MVTGRKNYEYAESMRSIEQKCGQDAKEFKINRFKIITAPYYYVIGNVNLWFVGGIASIIALPSVLKYLLNIKD